MLLQLLPYFYRHIFTLSVQLQQHPEWHNSQSCALAGSVVHFFFFVVFWSTDPSEDENSSYRAQAHTSPSINFRTSTPTFEETWSFSMKKNNVNSVNLDLNEPTIWVWGAAADQWPSWTFWGESLKILQHWSEVPPDSPGADLIGGCNFGWGREEQMLNWILTHIHSKT